MTPRRHSQGTMTDAPLPEAYQLATAPLESRHTQ